MDVLHSISHKKKKPKISKGVFLMTRYQGNFLVRKLNNVTFLNFLTSCSLINFNFKSESNF